ncbi:Hypothetical predicted protein, partial [Paramuricea clavata]
YSASVPDAEDNVPDAEDKVPDAKDKVPDAEDKDKVPDAEEKVPDCEDKVPDCEDKDKVPDGQSSRRTRFLTNKVPDSEDKVPQCEDVQKQLKRVSIPVFSGDKRNYENWKATFIACIDQAPASPEYKLLQLRQYLSGEALKTVEKFGHSAIAYEAAKERLDRKYGGTRRQVALYLEELENVKAIRPGNSKDLEEFVDIYRCLSEVHTGSKCTKSRCCGVDGCTKTHNRLLHGYPQTERKEMESNQRENCERLPRNGRSISQATQTLPTTEGEHPTEVERSLTTRVESKISQRQEFLAMRTVPVILINGNRKMTVNTLLDDANTKTYINADVAAELGLHGNLQRTNVNVLNGQIETFLTMPVEFKLESLDGKVNTTMEAYTTEKVTGDMKVVNWNQYATKWSHLKDIEFPVIASKPFVDILIGLDYADLHYSVKDVRGQVNEPIARLTPLGWTCIGVPQDDQLCQLTNFNRTYFTRKDHKLDEVDAVLRKFWENENVVSIESGPWQKEDHLALQKVEQSLKYENGRYQVAIPWKRSEPTVSNNYGMAFRRLQNTEKRLKRNIELVGVYSDIIERYIQKEYIRK